MLASVASPRSVPHISVDQTPATLVIGTFVGGADLDQAGGAVPVLPLTGGGDETASEDLVVARTVAANSPVVTRRPASGVLSA